MMDIFEYLRKMMECQYISDLRYEPYKTRAQKLLITVPLDECPLEALSDLAEYLYGRESGFQSIPQAIAFYKEQL